jgi:predicted RNA-binding Zn-ribbon protein involved in translation (DUF1610 family)
MFYHFCHLKIGLPKERRALARFLYSESIHRELEEAYKLTIRPEFIEYRVAADFSLKEGILQMRCPNCNGAIDLVKNRIEVKKYKCPYCGTNFILPEKLLSLL